MFKLEGFWNKGINNFLVKSSILLFVILFLVQVFIYYINKSITIPNNLLKYNKTFNDFSISYKSIMPNYGKLLIKADKVLDENISILLNGINILDKNEIFVKEGDIIEIVTEGDFNDYNTITLVDMKNNIKNINNKSIILKRGLYEIFVVNLE